MFQLDKNYLRKRLVAQVIKNISIAPPTNTWVYQQMFNLQHIAQSSIPMRILQQSGQ